MHVVGISRAALDRRTTDDRSPSAGKRCRGASGSAVSGSETEISFFISPSSLIKDERSRSGLREQRPAGNQP